MNQRQQLARMIDHALLHPTMSDEEARSGCQLAASLELRSVCVKPYLIPMAARELAGTSTAVGTVIGFPHGGHPTAIKTAEANWALDAGAVELDMVVNIGKALQGDWDFVSEDIRAVVQIARNRRAIVKVIFETDYIDSLDCKRRLCEVSETAGADFVKTSTGFGFIKQPGGGYDYRGATPEDVQLMRAVCSPRVGVKASGGIRSLAQALVFVKLGATRLGTSASEAILKDAGLDESSY